MKNIYSIIKQTAGNHLNDICLIYKNDSITYSDLLNKANIYASHLNKSGLNKNDIVCIISGRSIQMTTCVVGIIQAGGAYLLIDPETPDKRIEQFLKETESKYIFIDDDHYSQYDFHNKINLTELYDSKEKFEFINCERDENYLTYVVYTSGTSGQPQAVMAEDKNILTYINSYISLFNINDTDIILQQSPIYYDGFAEEMFSMLFTGGTIILPVKHELKNAKMIRNLILKHKITILPTTPLILNELNKEAQMSSIRAFVSSGDVLRFSHYNYIVKYTNVYNMYGPTETTVCACYYKCSEHDSSLAPIGIELDGYQVYILDENLCPVKTGETGEIYISGGGVSRGYLNCRASTEKAFIIYGKERAYKTGDLAYKDKNNRLHFAGRKDRQIKLNGNRIELNEIENIINKCPEINNISVLPLNDNNDGENIQICAFFMSESYDEMKLKEYCRLNMPNYMIPAIYKKMTKFPVTDTGKPDYKLMKSYITLSGNISLSDNTDELDKVQLKILMIIKSVLENRKSMIKQLSVNDSLDTMGMDSISYINIIVTIEEAFNFEFKNDYLDYGKFKIINDIYFYVMKRIGINHESA